MAGKLFVGIDIGGTKTAVILIKEDGRVLKREQFTTDVGAGKWELSLKKITSIIKNIQKNKKIDAIGISCGGPLDSRMGLILSPPNLPGWDKIPIVKIIKEQFKLPTYLQNDANAGALAEWTFGAGKGTQNMIFITFGTGCGAGLILNSRLYSGTNDLGGEIGHIRLDDDGPIGFHKRGSFEGFCSGTGLAQMMAIECLCLAEEIGRTNMLRKYKEPGQITGQDVVKWANNGDTMALRVVEKSGFYLGKGLSILIDTLNPEVIIIGSMGVRLGELLFKPARKVITREAIPAAARICRIVPAQLGEKIGDYAALCVAMQDVR